MGGYPVTRLLWISKEKIILKKKNILKAYFPVTRLLGHSRILKSIFFRKLFPVTRLPGYSVTLDFKRKNNFEKKYFKSLFPGYLVTRLLKNFTVHFFQKTFPGYSVTRLLGYFGFQKKK